MFIDATDTIGSLCIPLRISCGHSHKIPTRDIQPRSFCVLETRLAEITEHYPQIKFRQVNHDKDHLHLLISIPPTMAVGKAIGIIKVNTARTIKQKFPFIKQVYWGTDAVWSEGYFVTTVGVSEAAIKKYIEEQGKKDLGQTLFEIN